MILYNKTIKFSILKKRYKVGKSDMNILENPNIRFVYAGLFSSGNEWIHPDKTEKTYEIIYVVSGKVHLHDESSGELSLEKGNLVILEPGVRHYGTKTSSGVSFYWVHFHVENGKLPFEKRVFEKTDNPHLFKELLHYAFLPEMPVYTVNSILIRILCELCYQSEESEKHTDMTAEKIYEWIRTNAASGLTVEKTALHFGFSPDHITRIIKKNYGVGVKSLINTFLLSKAKELLANTGKYVKEIAYELEFESDKAFIAFFKYHEGVFPSEFRDRFYKIHMNRK